MVDFSGTAREGKGKPSATVIFQLNFPHLLYRISSRITLTEAKIQGRFREKRPRL